MHATASHPRSLLRLAALAAALLVAAPVAAALPGSQLLDWQSKVDASVLEAAALGETELLIYLGEQADLSGAYELSTKEEKGRYVYGRLTEVAEATQAGLRAELALLGADYRPFWIVNAIWARGDLAVVEAVARLPEVAHVYAVGFGGLDTPVSAGSTDSAGTAESLSTGPAEWNVEIVGAPAVWAMGYTGQGAVVAGADTGVFWQHEALKDRYRGWDGATAVHDYNWHDAIHNPNTGCPGSSPEPCDDDVLLGGGHGTHTVGTIVGDGGPGNRIGMAPDARWIACRNMNNGLGAVPTYLECMEWFLAPTDGAGQNPDPAKAPHVINNSWGCVEACPPPVLKAQLEASRAAGIVYVVSAGNDGSQCSTLIFPLAIYEGAFSVGATDRNDGIAGFSSRGPILTDVPNPPRQGPDISAPGVGVRSALRNGGYGSLSGTSMAGPHVAGLVALLISADPDLAGDVERIEEIVMATAVGLTTTQGCGDDTPTSVPNNSFGWGRIDALAAVEEALGDGGGEEPPPCPFDETVTFSDDLEPAPEPGWSVETAANASPASLPWTAAPDPFARSPLQSFASDATTLDVKDDRLVSPPLAITADSHLAFWHRFDFEAGFDGGVLEVSADGGATWVDAVAGGGAFTAGGYNGTISTEFGSPIAGRAAWTGSSGSPAVMVRSEVDLGAFAGGGAESVRVRWRLAADPLAPGALPGLGWWIDDVSVIERIERCPNAPVAVDDAAATVRDTPVTIDVLANDSDPDGEPLAVESVDDPANGSARVEADQRVTYTPDPGFTGTDTFDYEVCDAGGLCDSATVTVTVEAEESDATRVSGAGSIADGGEKAHLNLDARRGEAGATGRLSYRSGDLRVKGTVESLAFPTAAGATLAGSCELADGTPCRFEAAAADGGEPGAGRDGFEIRITDAAGALLHEAAGVLETGNLKVE